jgi:hypothetical protein
MNFIRKLAPDASNGYADPSTPAVGVIQAVGQGLKSGAMVSEVCIVLAYSWTERSLTALSRSIPR